MAVPKPLNKKKSLQETLQAEFDRLTRQVGVKGAKLVISSAKPSDAIGTAFGKNKVVLYPAHLEKRGLLSESEKITILRQVMRHEIAHLSLINIQTGEQRRGQSLPKEDSHGTRFKETWAPLRVPYTPKYGPVDAPEGMHSEDIPTTKPWFAERNKTSPRPLSPRELLAKKVK